MPSLRLLALAAQLAALLWVATIFEIESAEFRSLLALATGGFVLHTLLPSRAQLAFATVLSVGGIALVLGVQAAGWVLFIGCCLIAICHLPIAFGARVAGLVAAGAAIFAAWRVGVDQVPAAVWPLVGSMFVFRIVLYMYSIRHDLGRHGWNNALSYFFLLPNVCFPLFPVVDYNTFERTYMRRPLAVIAQEGARWIAHGFVHLMLYRIVYHALSTPPADVTSGPEALWFSFTNALLYLRVSGQFHVIVGMLMLFGFDLPRTHRYYLLAENFSDFWRRVNIYWKDFMVKLLYYPTFFRLKGRGRTPAMVVSVIVVFVASWFLHSYQTLWLLGVWDMRWQDTVFWAVLGALVLYNSLRTPARTASASPGGLGVFMRRALRVFGTFWSVCFMWSLWAASSVAGWLGMWARATRNPLGDWSLAGALLAATAILLALGAAADITTGGPLASWLRERRAEPGPSPSWSFSAGANAALIAALVTLGLSPWVSARIPAAWVNALHNPGLNERDRALLVNGYYERIITGARLSPEIFAAAARSGQGGENFYDTDVGVVRDDFGQRHLAPSARAEFRGTVIETNSHGMRDREYAIAKPPETTRIAVLGASMTMGWGVAQHESFEAQLETRLRADRTAGNVEVLNFAVPGHSVLEQPWVYEHKVRAFAPDMVLLVVASVGSRPAHRLADKLQRDIEIPYRDLVRLTRADAIEAPRALEPEALARRLDPGRRRLGRWSYNKLAEFTRNDDVAAMGVLTPPMNIEVREEELNRHLEWLREAGLEIADLRRVFGGRPATELRISDYDRHPSAAAHIALADALYDALATNPVTRAILWPEEESR